MDALTIGNKRQRNHEENQMQNKKHESSGSGTHNTITALLVDGVTTNRCLEHNMLESIGIQTQSVINTQEAIQLLLTGVKFDFIFVDFDLSSTSGPQFVRQMRAMGLGVESKVVGMLTQIGDSDRQRFHESGANGITEKPLTRRNIKYIIDLLQCPM